MGASCSSLWQGARRPPVFALWAFLGTSAAHEEQTGRLERTLVRNYDADVTSADPYDQLPYTDHAYAESHPDPLAVVGRLSGWEAPDVPTARVLELGCGRGGN